MEKASQKITVIKQDENLNQTIPGSNAIGTSLAFSQKVLLTTNRCLTRSGPLKTTLNSSHHAKLTY